MLGDRRSTKKRPRICPILEICWYVPPGVHTRKSMQFPVFLLWMLSRQNIKFVIAANVSLPQRRKDFHPGALSWTLNSEHWRTRPCKEQVQPELPVKTIELLETASMHVFSGECITTRNERGYASSMTHLKFCRGRPLSMDLHALPLMYSWCQAKLWKSCQNLFRPLYEGIKSFAQWATFSPACFCMGRHLCLEPIFPVATRCYVLWHHQALCSPHKSQLTVWQAW